MRKIYLVIFLLLALFVQAQAQSRAKVFRGSLAGKGIQMTLVREGEKLSGTYFYNKIGKDLNLSGKVDAQGNFNLIETDAKNIKTGEFKGVWKELDDESVLLEGEWINPKTKENIGFSAEEQMIFFTSGAKLVSKSFSEQNKPKLFDITIDYPELSGANMVIAAKFNQAVKDEVMKEVAEFRKSMLAQDAEQVNYIKKLGVNNYLEGGYNIDYADDKIISVGFGHSVFSGGAHPNHYSFTVNYDLQKGKKLELADLFKANSNYLKFISDYSIKSLKEKAGDMSDDEWRATGAGPKAENFKSWTLTKKGIWITFDPYQVAAYAAGPQDVLIPYGELKNLLRADSVVAELTK